MILGVDHFPVIVRDFEASVAAYTALLGRRPVFTGRYPGARSAWFQLPDIAIDLIAPDGEGGAGDGARLRLERHGEGPSLMAFTVADLDAARRKFSRRGLAVADPADTVSEDGAHAWRIATIRASSTRGLHLAMVEKLAQPIPVSPPVESEGSAVQGLDHVVVRTEDAEATVALYGARLGLDLRLERSNPAWGSRLHFFKAGPTTVEIGAKLGAPRGQGPDRFGGFAWKVADAHAARERMAAAGFDVSEVRPGRKAGTQVFTLRSGAPGAPALMIAANTQDL